MTASIDYEKKSRTDLRTNEPMNMRKEKIKQQKQNYYCQLCHTSVLMRVLCSVLLRGVGHIRQLYP